MHDHEAFNSAPICQFPFDFYLCIKENWSRYIISFDEFNTVLTYRKCCFFIIIKNIRNDCFQCPKWTSRKCWEWTAIKWWLMSQEWPVRNLFWMRVDDLGMFSNYDRINRDSVILKNGENPRCQRGSERRSIIAQTDRSRATFMSVFFNN